MLKIIAHRGNLIGPNPYKENHPEYIDRAIGFGFDVEIDLWIQSDTAYLGHDEPYHFIDTNWLLERADKLWIHCKNIDAAVWAQKNIPTLNFFWHQNDTMTLTNKGYWWVYPGNQPVANSIAVMPELKKDSIDGCYGVCTDYPVDYAEGRYYA